MSRNVEIKARLENVKAIRSRVETIAEQGPFELIQDDTFFTCANGRIKLRTGAAHDEGELIYYRRADSQGPKESFYVRSRTSDPDLLRESLTLAYGQAGRVKKHRTLFLVGRTRVHLDAVEGLGHFLELEVVLSEGESSESGVAEANALLSELGIRTAQLIERAYVDLLHGSQPWR